MMERLPDKLDANARVEVRVDGTVVGTRRIIDFTSDDSSVVLTNVNDDGVNDVLTVDLSTSSGGSDLWEEVTGDLHPVAVPDSVSVEATTEMSLSTDTGNITLSAANFLQLLATVTANLIGDVDVNVQASAGDANVVAVGGDAIITGDRVFLFGVGGLGNSLSLYADGAVNLYSEGKPLDLVAHLSDINISAGGNVVFTSPLPTSDPGVSGALYTLAGILHVSP